MSKLRRFRVDSLEGIETGARVELPSVESKHIRVLRMKAGAEVELFDGSGRSARAVLEAGGAAASIIPHDAPSQESVGSVSGPRITLAIAWPKGKRAATLIEKCTELGADRFIPLLCARGVVVKDAGSEGVARLKRVAVEAAKQCGRPDVPTITPPAEFSDLIQHEGKTAQLILLDPRADFPLHELIAARLKDTSPPGEFILLIGPEGGFTPDELEAARAAGAPSARLAQHILRIETAAMAACAVAGLVRVQP